jgi:hypothetical protein
MFTQAVPINDCWPYHSLLIVAGILNDRCDGRVLGVICNSAMAFLRQSMVATLTVRQNATYWLIDPDVA